MQKIENLQSHVLLPLELEIALISGKVRFLVIGVICY